MSEHLSAEGLGVRPDASSVLGAGRADAERHGDAGAVSPQAQRVTQGGAREALSELWAVRQICAVLAEEVHQAR